MAPKHTTHTFPCTSFDSHSMPPRACEPQQRAQGAGRSTQASFRAEPEPAGISSASEPGDRVPEMALRAQPLLSAAAPPTASPHPELEPSVPNQVLWEPVCLHCPGFPADSVAHCPQECSPEAVCLPWAPAPSCLLDSPSSLASPSARP